MQRRMLSPSLIPVLGVLLAGNTALGRQDRFQEEFPVRTFALTETEAEIGTEYHYFGETIRRDGSGRTRYSNHYFQEYIEGRVRGYGYHQRFINFSASLKLGMTQHNLHHSDPIDGDRNTSGNDGLLGYSFRADILQDNPVSGTINSSREERMLMGLFLDRYRVITDSHGGTVRWRRDGLRMDLTGTHTETEEHGFRSTGRTISDTLLFNLRHDLGHLSRTDVRYRLQSFERDFTARTHRGDVSRHTENVTNDLNITNRLSFDRADRLNLRSTLRVHDREGEQDLRTYFLEEMLRYNALRMVRPYIRGSVRRHEFAESTSDVYRGETGFDGDLYRSLSYHFDVHGTHSDHEAYKEDRYGVTGRINYRKDTGYGMLTAGYARTLDQVERTGSSALLQIFDETLVVNTAFPSFLSQPNVIAGSVRVTDTANQIVYTEGFDYQLITQGVLIGLRVIPGGILPDGSTVLVDYQVQTTADQSYIADSESIHVRHDFTRVLKELSLYGRRNSFATLDEEPDDTTGPLEYTNHLVGLRQGWRQFAFTSEYEIYDDEFGGYDRWRNQVEGNHNLSSRIRLGWSVGVDHTEFDSDFDRGDDDWSRHTFVSTHLDGTFARSGFWRVQGNVMHDEGRTERTTRGILGTLGYKWRRFTFEGGGRIESFEGTDIEQDRMQAFVGVKFNLHRRYGRPRR